MHSTSMHEYLHRGPSELGIVIERRPVGIISWAVAAAKVALPIKFLSVFFANKGV